MTITTNEQGSRVFIMEDVPITEQAWLLELQGGEDVLVVTDDVICNSIMLGSSNNVVVFHKAKVGSVDDDRDRIILAGSNRSFGKLTNASTDGGPNSFLVPFDSFEYLKWSGRFRVVKGYGNAASEMKMYLQSMTDTKTDADTLKERMLILRDASVRLLETLASETV